MKACGKKNFQTVKENEEEKLQIKVYSKVRNIFFPTTKNILKKDLYYLISCPLYSMFNSSWKAASSKYSRFFVKKRYVKHMYESSMRAVRWEIHYMEI